ncbi:hypothetical protein TraAM80_08234 [Trypanosoma rangeli]|uniref:Cilia- and flagella-associated protein 263 n=1 Tax=Trypanosoma rangeli TaxID=5698 RepID=A0A422N1M9_TRYRA|nr:uncharacterized protein TraAM80_08234 [Trypanosoma rangeli]RNE99367.1 hypothetical protein TraAM80_08234 [Trypanosoma rangeli]|eukprot:RNE99367.1 hypothetical protein TraAM80_08234 [Trypanosoma rangeli]
MSILQASAAEGGPGNSSFDFLACEGNEQQVWAEVYLREFPDLEKFGAMTMEEQREVVAGLQEEVDVLEEEMRVFVRQADSLRVERPVAVLTTPLTSMRKSLSAFLLAENALPGVEESSASESVVLVNGEGGGEEVAAPPNVRRGQAYSRKLVDTTDVYVALEDRVAMFTKERDRLRQQRDRDEREGEHLRNLLTATVKEAVGRSKELRLELLQLQREVLNEGSSTASSDDLLRFMDKRYDRQAKYLDKLNVQCAAAERKITQTQLQIRQRHAAGEAFHAIDFEQLRIENQQFNERIERKNLELVELKGTSTRTVQTLNSLMDTLNGLTTEQNRLRKDLKSRREYLARLQREMVSVAHEADVAERKNATIKAQHEAVRVPKIEHYVAQKAEEYELKKAQRNWKRKVEIAEGQLCLIQQQIRTLAKAVETPRRWVKELRRQMGTPPNSFTKSAARGGEGGSMYTDAEGKYEVQVKLDAAPVVGGSKALLDIKRKR